MTDTIASPKKKRLTKAQRIEQYKEMAAKATHHEVEAPILLFKDREVVIFHDPLGAVKVGDVVSVVAKESLVEYSGVVTKIKPLKNMVGINPHVCLHFKGILRNPESKQQRPLGSTSSYEADEDTIKRIAENKKKHLAQLDSMISVLERDSESKIKDYNEDEEDDKPEIISMDELAEEEQDKDELYGYY